MSDPTVQIPDGQPTLSFHPGFEVRQTGDIILLADDEAKTAFYFGHTLLAALSNFFANIPPSSAPADTYNGTPVIPLLESTREGLHIFLQIVQSTTAMDALSEEAAQADGSEGFLGAAEIAMKYQCPIVIRLLADAVSRSSPHNDYLRYALWIIAGDPTRVEAAAKATTAYGMDPTIIWDHSIMKADPVVVATVKRHAPTEWARLQDLHIRRIFAVPKFLATVDIHPEQRNTYCPPHDNCPYHNADPEDTVVAKLRAAESVEEIIALRGVNSDYGLDCHHCAIYAYMTFMEPMKALIKEAGEY